MFEHCKLWKVLINLEGQYSIWPASRPNPSGWSNAGKEGEKEECLKYIKEVWNDMRPLSLQAPMDMNPLEISKVV